MARADARAGCSAAGCGAGGGDKGVGAVVDVEHCALGAFEDDVVARFAVAVGGKCYVGDERADARGVGEPFGGDVVVGDGRGVVVVFELEVVEVHQFAQAFAEGFRVHEVGQSQAAARDFVFVGGADAASGGADFVGAARGFACLVERAVARQDEGAGGRDVQALHDGHTGGFQRGDFGKEGAQAEDDAVADVAFDAFVQDACRDEVQHGFFAVNDEGVAGVVPALVAHDGARFFGEQIDDFAFAFVAPLGADDDQVCTHGCFPWLSVGNAVGSLPSGKWWCIHGCGSLNPRFVSL